MNKSEDKQKLGKLNKEKSEIKQIQRITWSQKVVQRVGLPKNR
jgi:hypothetical protein